MSVEQIHLKPYGVMHEFDLASTRVRLFCVRPNSRTGQFHGHNALVSMIMAGSCFKTSRYETKPLASGSVAAMKKSEGNAEIIAQDQGICWFHIELNDEHQHQVNRSIGRQLSVVRSTSPSLICLATGLLRFLRYSQDDCHWDSEVLIDEFVSELIDNQHNRIRDDDAAKRLREIIRERYYMSLEVAMVSQEIGRNPSHLGRTFKARFGCSPGEYLRRTRFSASLPRLASGESVVNIACACGFADESHFCRVFKHYSGFTPSEWRLLYKPPFAIPSQLPLK